MSKYPKAEGFKSFQQGKYNQYLLYYLFVRVASMQEQNYCQINNRVNSIVCFLCGREFGTKGFAFHHKECKIKFQNQQKSRNPKDRTKAPEAPEGINFILQGQLSKIDLKKFNILSNEIYKYKALPACKYCGRTFNYESLITHMKGCDKQKGYKQQKENISQIVVKTPKNLVCCVCGQRFGTLSLKIHYPQCTKKFIDDQFRKHKKQSDRRKPPQFSKDDQVLIKGKIEWLDEQIQSFNNRATEMYRDKSMAECFNCKRKFFDEQLQKHQKNCILINGVLSVAEKVEKKEVEMKKPRTIMCVICGREYGQASIAIHAESCSDLFQKQQNLKLKGQRKALPEIPIEQREKYNLKQSEQWPSQKLEAYNKLVSNIYNTKSLSKCYICQRTFFEQSLPKHLKDCQTKIKDVKKLQKFKKEIKSKESVFGESFIDDVIQMNKQLNKLPEKSSAKPKVLMCYLCGRDYGITSLKIHLPQCKQKSTNSKKLQEASFQSICQQIEAKYTISQSQNWNMAQIQAYNKEVYEIYKKQSLFECKYCHRTFFQQSLKKHIKHCEKDSKSKLKRAQTMKDLKSEQKIEDLQNSQNQVQRQVSLTFINEDDQCHSNEERSPLTLVEQMDQSLSQSQEMAEI